MSFHLLLVEDDKDLGRLINEELRQEFDVSWAQSLSEASNLYKERAVDMAIVDLFLPDGKGFELIKEVGCPVIMMSALSDPENRLEGVELGAVDFMPKPFLIKELLIKIHRVLKDLKKSDVWNLDQVVLDMEKRHVSSEGEMTFLNRRDFRLLEVLISKAPHVVTRDEIIDYVYGKDQNPSHRTVDNAIVGLRQLLKDEQHSFIRSVRGEGYQWSVERKS